MLTDLLHDVLLNPTQRLFWSTPRLHRLCWAIIVAILLSLTIAWKLDDSAASLLKRGDFPGFYAPAVILKRGLENRLYKPGLQLAVEKEFFPSFRNEFYMSVYPPYVALMLKPLSYLGPLPAKLLATGMMLLCFFLTVILLVRLFPRLRGFELILGVYLISLAPVFISIFGTQNSALSSLLYLGVLWALSRGDTRSEVLAGVLLGLWLFKPQFALLAIVFPLLAGRIAVFVGFLLPAALYYLLGATVLGYQWPLIWVEATKQFATQNFIVNGHQMVSFMGAMSAVSQEAARWGLGGGALRGLGIALSVLVFLLLLLRCLQTFRLHDQEKRALYVRNCMLLVGPAVVLLSPQTLFYDLGLALFPCLALAKLDSDRAISLAIALSVLISGCTFLRGETPLPLLFLVAVAAFLLLYRALLKAPLSSFA